MQRSTVETVLGGAVLLTALVFGTLLYKEKSFTSSDTYPVFAHFDRLDGIRKGSEVKIAGIQVGKVLESDLDPKTYLARVKVEIDKRFQLPTDSSLEITSEGLFGKRYLSLTLGSDDQFIPSNGQITFTQAGADLMQLLNKFMFSQKGEEDKKNKPSSESITSTPSSSPSSPNQS